jgi:hypothetical protein
MSQGSNFKKEVMEALFNAPTNLVNNKVIMWAASNLPDDGGVGKYNSDLSGERGSYDHDTESFWTAIGMKGETPDEISDKVRDAILQACREGKRAKSAIFEHIEKTCGYEGIMFLATKGFFECMELLDKAISAASTHVISSERDLDKILKELEDLRKRLGGDK